MIASSATGPSRFALPMMPWMRPPSKRLSRDQYTIGSSAGEVGITKPGRIGPPMKIDTHSSKTSERAMTHLSADAIARTSSRHVRTLPMNRPCSVVITSSSRVRAVASRHCDQMIDSAAHAT